jgi:hypothetical protein
MKFFQKIFAFVFSLLLLTGVAYAETTGGSIVTCGETSPCTVDNFVTIVKGAVVLLLMICLPILVVYVVYRFVIAWYQVANGNSSAYRDAVKKAGNAIFGFFMAVLVFGGGLLLLLKIFGAKDFTLKLLNLFSEAFIPHAYAAGSTLPLPTTFTNLFDFILAVLRVVMRFFIYPALIAMWAWTGFSFVYAQGRPEALAKAKKLLFWATLSTFIVFITQGAITAMKGTAEQIVPGAFSSGNDVNPGNQQNCPTGQRLDANGLCVSSNRGNTATECSGKTNGTICSVQKAGAVGGYVPGTCSSNTDGTFGCNVAVQNDFCLALNATGAQVDGHMVKNSVGTLDCAPIR